MEFVCHCNGRGIKVKISRSQTAASTFQKDVGDNFERFYRGGFVSGRGRSTQSESETIGGKLDEDNDNIGTVGGKGGSDG